MKKRHINDLNEVDLKSQEGNEKELMQSEEVDDEEGDPKVIENDEVQSDLLPTMKVPPLSPQRLKKKKDNFKFKMFLAKLSNLLINFPLLEAIQEILIHAKLMKKLMSKKQLVDGETIEITHGCSTIMTSAIVEKKEDLWAFIIPCTVRTHKFEKASCDLGTSINIIPYAIYKKLGLGTSTQTIMRLLMVD
ncbi:uncharacterized protein LOC124885759 [Capsicum annuum]|uniref:uncharacterized protein LOC124885759 n=1 Tax=Capsicum annuum TaxID=4072 RepID=UPI001FB0E872|nr:uncharacterized protein LOC124885759 [Capsicum annuum]